LVKGERSGALVEYAEKNFSTWTEEQQEITSAFKNIDSLILSGAITSVMRPKEFTHKIVPEVYTGLGLKDVQVPSHPIAEVVKSVGSEISSVISSILSEASRRSS
jgi:hypothetical protein